MEKNEQATKYPHKAETSDHVVKYFDTDAVKQAFCFLYSEINLCILSMMFFTY